MRISILVSILFVLIATGLQAANKACITVSSCSKPPTIDGALGTNEWDDAASISNFIEPDSLTTASPNSIAYIMADDHYLYVGMKLVEPDAKGPVGFNRAYDDRVSEDDSVQVFIAPEDMSKAKEAVMSYGGYEGSFDNWYTQINTYYEFALNCKGSRLDAKNDVRAWNSDWKAKVQQQKGYWTAEFAIPFDSVGAKSCPWNTLWGMNIFRNRKFLHTGLSNCYYGGYTPMPIAVIYFSPDKIYARQNLTVKPKAGNNNIGFEVVNKTGKDVDAVLAVTVGDAKTKETAVKISANQTKSVAADFVLKNEGNVSAKYELKLKDREIPLLQGTLGNSLPQKIQTNLRYFANLKEVRADIVLLPGSKAAKAVLSIQTPAGKKSKTVSLVSSKGTSFKMPIAGKIGDRYSATLDVTSADGKILDSKKCESVIVHKYNWDKTRAGLPLKVLPPWSPVKIKNKQIDIDIRTIVYSNSALPDQVVALGKKLFKTPIRIVVKKTGREVPWTKKSWKVISKDDTHAKIRSVWKSKDFVLNITSDVEYDGFCWNEASLIPVGKQTLDSVSLETVLDKDIAKYYCLGVSRLDGKISPVGLRTPLGFSNNIWIGDERRGVSWLIESDEWIKSDKYSSQIQVLPVKNGSLWKTSYIDKKTTITSPYNMKFALQYTPTKEVTLKKSHTYHPMAEWTLPTAKEPSQLAIASSGNITPDKGTLEFWAKPTFDTNETYDPAKDRSAYNRQFFTFITEAKEVFILYYNADARNFVVIKRNADGNYPMVMAGGDGRLSTEEWTYVSLSWGDKIRLQVNETVREFDLKGSAAGDLSVLPLIFNVNDFQLDDLRISNIQRPTGKIPDGPLKADENTLVMHSFDVLDSPEKSAAGAKTFTTIGCKSIPGKFGNAIALGEPLLHIDYLAQSGVKTVIFHEDWSRYQGYPDLLPIPKLKAVADACHARGMRFVIYFNQDMSDAAPEWKGMEYDFGLGGIDMNYRREYDEIKQSGYYSCVNGPFGDLLLDGIARIADLTGIDGVYMDGTSVAWPCSNPTHPGCGDYLGNGKYLSHIPLRATRNFLKRLRNIFVQRGKDVYMCAHTGGGINVGTNSLCDSYLDGEALASFKNGYILEPEQYIAAYMGNNYGTRGEFLPGKFTTDQGLAISLVHDNETRWQPAVVTTTLARYEDKDTKFIPYWDRSNLYSINSNKVLGSLYLKKDSALLVIGSQTSESVDVSLDVDALLKKLGKVNSIKDVASDKVIDVTDGKILFSLSGRGWKMLEFATNLNAN